MHLSALNLFRLIAPVLLLDAAPVGGAAAIAATGPWHGEGNAQVRLIAAGIGKDGQIEAGLEIALQPGWKTYWRTPGDAGVAPLFDFSGSTNIDGPVEVEFPVPHRVDDGYAVSNVYERYVVLPVGAKVFNPEAPTTLALSLDIGVCAEICIPEHYDLSLEVVRGEADETAEAILNGARAALPGGIVPDVFEVEGVARIGGTDKRPVFEVAIVAPDAAAAEVFVEGPVDWFPSVPKLVSSGDNRATYSVEFSRYDSTTAVDGNTFTVTIVAHGKAVEDKVTLD